MKKSLVLVVGLLMSINAFAINQDNFNVTIKGGCTALNSTGRHEKMISMNAIWFEDDSLKFANDGWGAKLILKTEEGSANLYNSQALYTLAERNEIKGIELSCEYWGTGYMYSPIYTYSVSKIETKSVGSIALNKDEHITSELVLNLLKIIDTKDRIIDLFKNRK